MSSILLVFVFVGASLLDYMLCCLFMFGGCRRDCVGLHQFITILTTSISAFSVIPQALKLKELGGPLALSLPGLMIQTVVFALLGVSWLFWIPGLEAGIVEWYIHGGWAVMGNLVFAGVQAFLFGYGLWVSRTQVDEDAGERTSLLT
jgi:hypothetical protein